MIKKNSEIENENSRTLKNFYDLAYLKRLGKSISKVHPTFKPKELTNLCSEMLELEMKERVHLIRDHLADTLPKDFHLAVEILIKATKDTILSGFDLWPFTEFVQTYGIDHPEISLDSLKYFTRLFTSEFAIRPFIIKYPELIILFTL